ncbi:MAG: GNAT family N-acetyltransferase [Planctomycetota bacterium]
MTAARPHISPSPTPTQVMAEAPPQVLTIRPALLADVTEVVRVLNESAEGGFTLPRTSSEVEFHLGGFVVATLDDRVEGCAALETINPTLAEVRSVAVGRAAAGTGVGRAMMTWLVDEARALEFEMLCLLTRVPGFFARFGFIDVEPLELPGVYMDRAIRARGRSLDGRVGMILTL